MTAARVLLLLSSETLGADSPGIATGATQINTDLTSGHVDVAERQVLPNRPAFRLRDCQGLGHSRGLSERIEGTGKPGVEVGLQLVSGMHRWVL